MDNLESIVNDDRLAFAEIAVTIARATDHPPLAPAVLSTIRKECEDRIAAIDKALGDT